MKFVKSLLLLSAFALAGCATTGGTTITVAQVEAAAVTACSFLPTAATVAALITANPNVATAEQLAAALCSLASAKAGRLGATMMPSNVVIPSGFVVHGKFTS
jgi:hypothetical protein